MNELMSGTADGTGGGHVDLDRLLAFARGEAGEPEATAVLQHGHACRACGNQLAVLMGLLETEVVGSVASAATAVSEPGNVAPIDTLPAATRPDTGPREAGRMPRWAAPLAASIVVALLVGAIVAVGMFGADDPGQGTGVESAPSAADVALGRSLATATPPDEMMLEFLFDDGALQAGGAGASRQEAIVAAGEIMQGRYGEAIGRLRPLHEARPEDGEVAMLLGIAAYLNGDNGAETAARLQQGRDLPQDDFNHLSAWYLANLFLRRGDLVQATEVLEEIAVFPDAPGVAAAELLERLPTEGR